MPLYKRNVPSQKNIPEIIKPKKSNKAIFKTPLKFNEIKISSNETEFQNETKSSPKKRQADKTLKEYSLNLVHNLKEFSNENVERKASKETINQIHKKKKNGNIINESDIFEKTQEVAHKKVRETKDAKINQKKKRETNLHNAKRTRKTDEKNISSSNDKKAKKSKIEIDVISQWSQNEATRRISVEPPEHFSHFERLVWLQEQRNVGLYVQCDKCDKFRYLPDTVDPLDLPDNWFCYMNPDKTQNKCTDVEVEIPVWEEDDLIHNIYHAGSIVWAKMDGYPWWPAMIDDCPDTEMYYWLVDATEVPTQYHVVFFDSKVVSRAWLKLEDLHKFKDNVDNSKFLPSKPYNIYKQRLNFAIKEAENALELSVQQRLKKYSFLARWPGKINKPNDVSEKKISKTSKKVSPTKTNKRTNTNLKRKLSKFNFVKSPIKNVTDEHNTFNISPDIFDDTMISELANSITYETINLNDFDDF